MAGSRRARRAPCRNPQEVRRSGAIDFLLIGFRSTAPLIFIALWTAAVVAGIVAVRGLTWPVPCRWSSRHCHRSGDSRWPLAACQSSLSRPRRLVHTAGSRHRCSRRRGDRSQRTGHLRTGWRVAQCARTNRILFLRTRARQRLAGARRHVRFSILPAQAVIQPLSGRPRPPLPSASFSPAGNCSAGRLYAASASRPQIAARDHSASCALSQACAPFLENWSSLHNGFRATQRAGSERCDTTGYRLLG